jgi:hypothetical protein
MSKSHPTIEADTDGSPIFATGGLVSVYVGDRARRKPEGLHRCGEGVSRVTSLSRQTLFAILSQRMFGPAR